jgi:heme-degrading monooxygenase HmoA
VGIAHTPEPPYVAVVFTSLGSATDPAHEDDVDGYGQTAHDMLELAAAQPGYLGVESARGADGLGITVSYWTTLQAVAAWKQHADHVTAQRAGRSHFYRAYTVRICVVERAYSFES